MYFLIGITGHVGGAAARALQGHELRGYVRDPGKAKLPGLEEIELARGDLADAEALAAAMRGAEAVFAMVPPVMSPGADFAQTRAYAKAIRAAVDRAKPERVVVLSSWGAEQPGGLGLITAAHILEQALWELPAVALVRAGGFLENFTWPLRTARQTGVLDTFRPLDAKYPLVATADIGATAARLLSSAWTGRRVLELGAFYSLNDIAAAMTTATGRPIVARTTPREHWDAAMTGMGLSPDGAANYAEMEEAIISGHISFGVANAERLVAPTPPAELFSQLLRDEPS